MRRAVRALGRRHAVSVQGALGGIDTTPWVTTSQIESRLRHAARDLQQGWRSSTLEQRVTRFFADSHFRSPTPIQAQCLPLAIGGRDLIALRIAHRRRILIHRRQWRRNRVGIHFDRR